MVCCDKVRRTVETAAGAAAAAAADAKQFELQLQSAAEANDNGSSVIVRNLVVVVRCASCSAVCSLAEVLFDFCECECIGNEVSVDSIELTNLYF